MTQFDCKSKTEIPIFLFHFQKNPEYKGSIFQNSRVPRAKKYAAGLLPPSSHHVSRRQAAAGSLQMTAQDQMGERPMCDGGALLTAPKSAQLPAPPRKKKSQVTWPLCIPKKPTWALIEC